MEIKPYKLFFLFPFFFFLFYFIFFNRERTLRTHLKIWEAQAIEEKRWGGKENAAGLCRKRARPGREGLGGEHRK